MGTKSGEVIYYAHELGEDFKEIYLIGISDLHYGHPLFSEKHLDKTIQFLRKPNAYGLLNGDLTEAATRDSVGDIYSQINPPGEQKDYIRERIRPYAHKILGAVDGNHEQRIWRSTGVSILGDITRELHIPYRPAGLLHRIRFGQGNSGHKDRPFVFWVYQTHGYGGARTKSAKAVKIERIATWIHADCYLMSHDHVVTAFPDVYLIPDPRAFAEKDNNGVETGFSIGGVTAHRKLLVKTNAFLKWGGYAEMGGFPPSDLTTPLIILLTPESSLWENLPNKPKRAIKIII